MEIQNINIENISFELKKGVIIEPISIETTVWLMFWMKKYIK